MGEFKLELQSGNAQFGSKSAIIFVPCDLEIWRMTLKNNRALLLCCFKLCASLNSHQWIQTGVTVRKLQIWVKTDGFLSRVTFWQMALFDRWPWKTIGHIFYPTSSFVHHFIAIGEFKLESQSENVNSGSKSTILFNHLTLKFDGWHWKTIGHFSWATSSFVHHFIIICEFKLELPFGNVWIVFWPLWPWPLTSDFDLLHGHHVCHW